MEKDDGSFMLGSELDKLKREIDFLKHKQGISEQPDNSDMQASISNISKSMNTMLRIFREASEDLKMDTHDAVLVAQKLDKILDRLDKIEVQNEKIAKGIVAVADMIEDLQTPSVQKRPAAITSPMSSPPPSPQPPQGNPYMQVEPKPLPTYNLPPEEKKKSGFINFKI